MGKHRSVHHGGVGPCTCNRGHTPLACVQDVSCPPSPSSLQHYWVLATGSKIHLERWCSLPLTGRGCSQSPYMGPSRDTIYSTHTKHRVHESSQMTGRGCSQSPCLRNCCRSGCRGRSGSTCSPTRPTNANETHSVVRKPTLLRRYLPYHTIPYHTIPYHTIPYHTIEMLPWTQPRAA